MVCAYILCFLILDTGFRPIRRLLNLYKKEIELLNVLIPAKFENGWLKLATFYKFSNTL